MLGQHVYLELSTASSDSMPGLWLPEYYICSSDEGESFVWAADEKGNLEQRSVTLGSYSEDGTTCEILDGLTKADYIAFPDAVCAVGVKAALLSGEEMTPSGGEAEQSGETEQSGAPEESGNSDLPESTPADETEQSSGGILFRDDFSGAASAGDLIGGDLIGGTASGGNLGG